MKKLFTTLLVASSLITIGQSGKAGKLKEEVNIDTLFVTIHFSDTTDIKLQKELLIQFDTLVSVFNREEKAFTLVIDSTKNDRSIKFLVGPINYVDLKRNLWVTGLDLAFIGANILILPYFPPFFPFYLMPATISHVYIKCSDDLLYKPPRLVVNTNGFWTKKERQKIRFKRKFDKVFYKYFKDLNKQNERNNRP